MICVMLYYLFIFVINFEPWMYKLLVIIIAIIVIVIVILTTY
jgi:hypothetical protein